MNVNVKDSRTVKVITEMFGEAYSSTYTIKLIAPSTKGRHGALLLHGIDYMNQRHTEYRDVCWSNFLLECGIAKGFNKVITYLTYRIMAGDVISLGLYSWLEPLGVKPEEPIRVDSRKLASKLTDIYTNSGKIEIPCIVNGLHGGLIITFNSIAHSLVVDDVHVAT